jgi:hypothetical protein
MLGDRKKRIRAQEANAGRDAYVAGRDQTIVNKSNHVVMIAVVGILAVVSASVGASTAYLTSRTSAQKAIIPSSPQKAIIPSSPPSGPPLSIVSEDPISPVLSTDWVLPGKVVLGNSQMNLLDSFVRTGSDASMTRYMQWFSSRGGYKTGQIGSRVVLENDRSYPIRIMGMNVVEECGPPIRGTVFMASGGAEDRVIGLGFSLGSTDTDAEISQGNGPQDWKPHYFSSYTISIEPGAQQVLNLFAFPAKEEACAFRYQATILDGRKKVNQLIGDGAMPFRVTAVAVQYKQGPPLSNYQAAYIGGGLNRGGAFKRVDPRVWSG